MQRSMQRRRFWNEFNEIHEYGNLSVSMPDMSLKVGDTTESVISFEKDNDVTVGTDCSGLQPGLYIICKNGRTKKVLAN